MDQESRKKKADDIDRSVLKRGFAAIFRRSNRGLLLDIVVFVLNVFLMRLLAGYFLDIAGRASNGDELSGFLIFAFCVSLFVLPPLGAAGVGSLRPTPGSLMLMMVILARPSAGAV